MFKYTFEQYNFGYSTIQIYQYFIELSIASIISLQRLEIFAIHLQNSSSIYLSNTSWITFCISSNKWIQCPWTLVFIWIMCNIFFIGFRSGNRAGYSIYKRPNFWHYFVVILEVWYHSPSSIQIISPLSSKQSLKNNNPSFFLTWFMYISEFCFFL